MAFALHTTQEGVILHGVSWPTYQQLLADRGLHSGVRFAFDRGTLEIFRACYPCTREKDHKPPDRALPDLVIEVDITHPSLDRLPIYAALGILEVWRDNGTHIDIHRLHGEVYTRVDSSTIFDGVTPEVLERMLALGATMSGTEWFKTVMAWAQSS